MNEIGVFGSVQYGAVIEVPTNLMGVVTKAFEHAGFSEPLSEDEIYLLRDLSYAFSSIEGGFTTVQNVRFMRQ